MSVETRVDGPRSSVFFIAKINIENKNHKIKVRNFSKGGALIEYDETLAFPKGTRGVLIRGESEIPFEVVWTTQGQSGLKFEREVTKEELVSKESKSAGVIYKREIFINSEFHKRPALNTRRKSESE